jgi:hypothetical protein
VAAPSPDRRGLRPGLAASLAADEMVDLHRFLLLLDDGCSPNLAARILAPLVVAPDPGR